MTNSDMIICSMDLSNPPYHSPSVHALMLSDAIRTETYRKAIESSVREGDVVVDVGTGTGILALFAARAGAEKVYAIEPTSIIEVAEKTARDNGLEHRINFINARIEDVELPEDADCIVSEPLGVYILQENMWPSLIYARDKHLKKDGKLIPEKVELFLGLVDVPGLYYEVVGKWRQRPYGFDFERFAFCQAQGVHLAEIAQSNLLSEPEKIIDLDFYNIKYDHKPGFSTNATLIGNEEGFCHGLGGWFKAKLSEKVILDTSPDKPVTEWQQTYFPFPEPIKMEEGERVNVAFSTEVDEDGRLVHFIREVNVSGQSFTCDTRKLNYRAGK